MQDISIIGIIVTVVVLVILLFMAIGYVKAPPDMAYIISGVKKKSKVVIGKASIRIPFFERLDKLNLRLIPIDVKTSNAVPTADYININVDATVNVKKRSVIILKSYALRLRISLTKTQSILLVLPERFSRVMYVRLLEK